MVCFARFDTICTIWKYEKHPQRSLTFRKVPGFSRTMCEICSKLKTKTSERSQWRRSGFFVVNLKQISHISLLSSLLTLNKKISAEKRKFWASAIDHWTGFYMLESLGTKYSRMDQVKFLEYSLQKIWRDMVWF